MSELRFSVLMSVYEKECPDFFDAALDSILIHQTRIPDEFILICDGPLTPGLEAVIAKYLAMFPFLLKVFRLEENRGLGHALNYGLDKCTCDWVARADSDDSCVETRFEEQLRFLASYPDTDIVSSYIDEFRENPRSPERVKIMPTDHTGILKMAKSRNPINHMAVIFRKSVIEAAGSYLPLPYVEDYYLWVRAIAQGAKLANVGAVLVHARIGNGMESRRGNPKQISGWRTINLFMLKKKMIGAVCFHKNMVAVRLFVFCPQSFKRFLYSHFLRSN